MSELEEHDIDFEHNGRITPLTVVTKTEMSYGGSDEYGNYERVYDTSITEVHLEDWEISRFLGQKLMQDIYDSLW